MTERKGEFNLIKQKAVFSESDSDMVFVLSSEGLIIDVNQAVETTLGYTQAQLLGKELVTLYPETHAQEVASQLNQMLQGMGGDFYFPMLTSQGDISPVDTKIFHATWVGKDVLIALCHNLALPKQVYKQRLSGVETFKPELFIYDLKKRRFIAVNHAVLKILGYHPDDLVHASINELTFLHLPGQILEISNAVNKGMGIKDYELIVTSKHGLPFSLTLDIDKFSVSGKELLFFVITHITELGAAEEKVRYQLLQQKLLASVSQLLNEPEFYRNLDEVLRLIGEHTGVSRTYIFEDNEARTETFNTFEWCNEGIEPAIADLQGIPYEIIPSWKRMLIGEGRVFSTDIMTLPADAVAILEPQGIKSILVYPLYNQKDFFGFIGFDECVRNKVWQEDEVELLRLVSNIISNALERRQMMLTITENETRLKLAIGNAREGVWDYNLDTGAMYVDEPWCRSLGYEPHELDATYAAYIKLVVPEDLALVQDEMDKHIEGKTEYFDCIYRVTTKQGEIRWLQNKGKVIGYNKEGKPIRLIGKFSDLISVKLAEEKLVEAVHREKELGELKSRFIANTSHEFRTPLATILMASESLSQYWERMDQDQVKARLVKINQQVVHLTKIVENVLQISKAHQGRMQMNPEMTEVVELCKGIINERIQLEKTAVDMVFDSSVQSYRLPLDVVLIRQMLQNLLQNAIRYTQGRPKIKVTLTIMANGIELRITDNGIGIPETDLPFLFTPFFRASNAGHTAGNGLGLSIVNEIVKLHKGKIEVESTLGQGTTFIVSLPEGKGGN